MRYHVTAHVHLESTEELLLEYAQACLKTKIPAQIICTEIWVSLISFFMQQPVSKAVSSDGKILQCRNVPFHRLLTKRFTQFLMISIGCFKIRERKFEIVCHKSKTKLKQRLVCTASWRKGVCKFWTILKAVKNTVCSKEFFPGSKGDLWVKFTAHLHLVPKLRVSGAIPLLHLHAFMDWTEITLLCTAQNYRYRERNNDTEVLSNNIQEFYIFLTVHH